MKHTFFPDVLLCEKVRIEWKPPYSWRHSLNSSRVPFGASFRDIPIGCFPRVNGISVSKTTRLPYPKCIHLWFVGKDFLILFIWEWTPWTGIRKRDNVFEELPSGNIHFVSGFVGRYILCVQRQNSWALRLRSAALSTTERANYIPCFVVPLIHIIYLA